MDYAQINNPEYINKLKNKNIQCVSNASFRYNSVEDNLIEVIRRHNLAYPEGDALLRLNNFVDPNSENYGNYNLITSSNSARYILKMYTPEQIAIALNNLKNGDLGSVFGNSATFDYGVDQGGIESLCKYKYVGPTLTVTIGDQNYILKDGVEYSYRFATMIYNELENRQQTKVEFVKIAYSKEYVYLKDKLISLGFSNRDASIILSSINDAGACSYAATANEIFACFIGREAEFEQKFGYPMFKIENGKKVLNSNELLLDLYVYCNKKSNGGRFILDDNTLNREFINYNKTDVFGRNLLKAKKQEYMSSIYGKSVNNISSFLRSKGVSYSSATLFTNPHAMLVSNSDFSNIIATMNEYMQYGCVFSMDIFQVRDENSNIVLGNTINMYSTNPNVYSSTSTATWNEGGGHAVFITGIGTDCFYVSSWGKEYSIPFSDLQNGGVFNIYWTQIK